MNDVIKTILARRSVRAFKDKQVPKEDLDTILECACHAPSAMNAQNWHFTAIRDVAVIERLNGWIVAEIKESGNPYLQVILCQKGRTGKCSETPLRHRGLSGKTRQAGRCQCLRGNVNMLLAAHSLGIGSCWIGTVGILGTCKRADEYASELKYPEGIRALLRRHARLQRVGKPGGATPKGRRGHHLLVNNRRGVGPR